MNTRLTPHNFKNMVLQLSTLSETEQEFHIQRLLVEMYLHNPEVLEAPSEIFAKLQQLLSIADPEIIKLSGLVATDSRLRNKVLTVANSVIYSGFQPSSTIQSAILRIGLNEFQCLLNFELTRRVYTGTNLHLRCFVHILWEHSMNCAVIAEFLAELCDTAPNFSASVYTAALLHDIGKLYALACVGRMVDNKIISNFPEKRLLFKCIGILHQERGSELLKRWKFEHIYCDVAKHHHERIRSASQYSNTSVYNVIEFVQIANNCLNAVDGNTVPSIKTLITFCKPLQAHIGLNEIDSLQQRLKASCYGTLVR